MTYDTFTQANECENTIQKQPHYTGKPMGLLRKTSDRFDKKWRKKHGL